MVLGGNINCMRGFYTGISKVQERDFDKVFTSNKETFKAGDGLDHQTRDNHWLAVSDSELNNCSDAANALALNKCERLAQATKEMQK